MLRLQMMRSAMVALTAIGMIWTTTAHAAGYESSATTVYNGNPITDPGNPTVPGGPPLPLDTRADIQVTFVSLQKNGPTYSWKYLIENISAFPAEEIRITGRVDRKDPNSNNVVHDPDVSFYTGPMGPHEARTATITCKPKPGLPACWSSGVNAWNYFLYEDDHNPNNNSAFHGID
jgi:hypothetical protein